MLRLFIRCGRKRGKSGWGADAGGLAAGRLLDMAFFGRAFLDWVFWPVFWHILKLYLLTHSEVSTSV